MHGPVRVPENVSAGQAEVEMSLSTWVAGSVTPTRVKVDVVAPKSDIKPEPVSPRLKASLVHPNSKGPMCNVGWSPDGKRLIAGDFPGGTVQIWDVDTGKQLTKIETGYSTRGDSEFVHLSRDWQSMYVYRSKRTITKIEVDGQRRQRWESDGHVGVWRLGDGQLLTTYQHDRPNAVITLQLAPDSKSFVTCEEVSGVYEFRPPRRTMVWDVATRKSRALPDGLNAYVVYSPDSKIIVSTHQDESHQTRAVQAFDVATLRQLYSTPITEPFSRVFIEAVSPGGQVMVGTHTVFPNATDLRNGQTSVRLWELKTGNELAAIPLGRSNAHWATFSPDGRYIAASAGRGEPSQVHLFDVARGQLIKSIDLRERTASVAMSPTFSLDGRWLAVPSRIIPPNTTGNPLPDDMPQPHIHIIEVATNSIRETIVAPPAFMSKAVFSPDGKTLASEGHGRVHLWDMTREPGSVAPKP